MLRSDTVCAEINAERPREQNGAGIAFFSALSNRILYTDDQEHTAGRKGAGASVKCTNCVSLATPLTAHLSLPSPSLSSSLGIKVVS